MDAAARLFPGIIIQALMAESFTIGKVARTGLDASKAFSLLCRSISNMVNTK